MSTVLINSKNTLFQEYLIQIITDLELAQVVDSCSSLICLEEKLKLTKYDFVFIDLFSRNYEHDMLSILKKYSDISRIVMFTTKENSLLNYFNYKYGIKHYIYLDDSLDTIMSEICSVFSGSSKVFNKSSTNVLTSRECEILKHIAEGMTSKEIAEELCISKNTVDTHRNKMLQKLNLANSASLVHYAFKSGMV